MVYSPTVSSDLFLIVLVLGLFDLAFFFLWGTNTSVFARLNKAPISILLPGSIVNRVRYQKSIRKSKNCEVDED